MMNASDLVKWYEGLADGVRAETEGEILDQALALLQSNYIVAAAVLAGGALETHLRHLAITKYGLTVIGDGTISEYDAVVAQARNSGALTTYGATDSKLIAGWGGIRNEATHSPVFFVRSSDDVRRMIEGIRGFMARTS